MCEVYANEMCIPQHAKSQLLFAANTSPLSIVPFEHRAIDLMALACDTFGLAVNLAT